ncbi:uncharacterized protein LOC104584942 [Brachypodium distachyon]|uniref:uncharacterized protein LOC104584942 n=1 Tax=Brachypodium distachyon TaxID=15368 RepID=UPI0005300617|nr:uncharacterized protein LOC104584942 [Brachypodium distachyon]|eukprot:XP_010239084.1 uncharacterized protein LOC104584942 [Brachypodium distachyon]
MPILAYFGRLKDFADQLCELSDLVTDRALVMQMFRGLHPRFYYTIPMLTSRVPYPMFLECRAFLALEESREVYSHGSGSSSGSDTALHVSAPANSNNSTNNRNRNRRNKGKETAKGKSAAGGSGTTSSTLQLPMPVTNPWTGLVHA